MKIFLIIMLSIVWNYRAIDYNRIDLLNQDDPFILKRKNALVTLPDSLGGKKIHGFAVIQLTLDEASHIKSVKILKLKLHGKKQINYWYQEKMTKQVAMYIPFLNDYAQKQKIEKNKFYRENVKKYDLSFMIRF